jgi:hypothetical protein
MTQMTEQQVSDALDRGDPEVMGLVARHEVEYVEVAPTEAPVSASDANPTDVLPVTEQVAPVLPIAPVANPTPEPVLPTDGVAVPPADPDNLYLEMLNGANEKNKTLEEQVASNKKLLDDKLEEQRIEHQKEIDNLKKTVTTPVIPAIPRLKEDETDDEFASNYSKNNRTEIQEMKSTVASLKNITPEALVALTARLDKIDESNKLDQEERERERKAKNADDNQNKMFYSIDKFIEGDDKSHLKLSKGIKEDYAEHTALRERITQYLKTDDEKIVEKALRGVVANDSEYFKGMRKKMESVGIVIPEDTPNYLKLSEIVDLKMGVKYNPTTGGYDKIVDDLGRQVCQASIEDAYKLSNYAGEMSNVARDQSLKIQQQLDNREDSAVSIPSANLSQGNESDQMTDEEMNSILDLSARELKNPEMKKKFDQIKEHLDNIR